MTLYADNTTIKGDTIAKNINLIDFSIITKLENDLEPHEIISLVFLLYDEPHVALQRVKLFETISRSTKRPNMNLLLDWAVKVKSTKPVWRYELLEALAICQLYSNIRKLEFDVSDVKKHFVPGNILLSVHIHPMKKVLYKICDGLTVKKLEKLKSALETYKVECDDVHIAEITFLQLICQKFITLGSWEASKRETTSTNVELCDVNDFAKILKGMSCKEFAEDLIETQYRLNDRLIVDKSNKIGVTVVEPTGANRNEEKLDSEDGLDLADLEERFKKLLENEEKTPSPNKMKKDATNVPRDAYTIIDPSDVGVCYIINQVQFYPSQESIKRRIMELEDRLGSDKDRDLVRDTFTKFGFTIVIDENLAHSLIKTRIQSVISERVKEKHSAFVLCILSHGLKGVIFGTDSVPVEVNEIQDMMYGNNAPNLIGKPKILLIQACQGAEGAQAVKKLVADGPAKIRSIPLKADLVTYWATVAGHASYRDTTHGSIFIQLLCKFLSRFADKDHLTDIFTQVNGFIMGNQVDPSTQVPVYDSTLRKKIYFITK